MTKYFKKVGYVIAAVVTAGIFIAPIPGFTHHAAGSTIEELRQRQRELEKQIKSDQAAKKESQTEQTQLSSQIKSIDTQITGIEYKIQETEQNIATNESEIREKESEIRQKEDELSRERDNQAETIRVIYETGNTSPVELLVGSGSISEVLVYREYLDALEGRIDRTIEEVSRIKSELEQKRTELTSRQTELERLKREHEAYKRGLAAQKVEKDRLLTDAKATEQQLATQIAEAQKVYADVNNELTRLQEAARRRAAQRARGEIPKGVSTVGFQWPTSFIYISTYFGGRTPFQSFHTGMDLVNYAGTPVVAAADGVVTYLGRVSYGYGTYVIVAHNERFSSLYAHFLGFADGLAVGQPVKRGDLIGYIGSTGWSTGPHLHFEVRDYGTPDNPLEYLP